MISHIWIIVICLDYLCNINMLTHTDYANVLVQGCCNWGASAMELLQYSTQPSTNTKMRGARPLAMGLPQSYIQLLIYIKYEAWFIFHFFFLIKTITGSFTFPINLSPPGAAYMRQHIGSALVQIMACRLSAASHYLNQCWRIVNWTLGNKFQWNLSRNSHTSIQENSIENAVCQIGGLFVQGR